MPDSVATMNVVAASCWTNLSSADAAEAWGDWANLSGARLEGANLREARLHYARMLRLDGAGIADEATAAQALGMKGSTFPARKALTQSRRLGHVGVAEAIRLLAERNR